MEVVNLIKYVKDLMTLERALSNIPGVEAEYDRGTLRITVSIPAKGKRGTVFAKSTPEGILVYQHNDEFLSSKLARDLLASARKLGWRQSHEAPLALKKDGSYKDLYLLVLDAVKR